MFLNITNLNELLDKPHVVHWFRRDLRWEDNMALQAATHGTLPVIPLFIFDSDILDRLEDKDDKRVSFIVDQLKSLHLSAREHGSGLLIAHGKPEQVFHSLVKTGNLAEVHANEDYEPYGINRDIEIKSFLQGHGIPLLLVKDQLIFRPGEITKDNGEPYTVYTPFMKKWKASLNKRQIELQPGWNGWNKLTKTNSLQQPSLVATGFTYRATDVSPPIFDENTITQYHARRDYPGLDATTRLGVHLRFGTMSIRKAAQTAIMHNEVWLNELIWREFFAHVLYFFPHVISKAFKPAYDAIPWVNDLSAFEHWKEGSTGYPLVDAGMRELRLTGFMHNRVRMVTASFLSKHLLTDWRLGEAWFARYLLDYELSSNNGNWQWAAGTGCDAAPYFRIFNPIQQQKKFDPDMVYIRRWIPEFGTSDYPNPIVNHEIARHRCLSTYKKALQGV